ncbi:MAG: hypothetical protein U0271_09805 [Polyangiaceae bacterium]
MAETLTEEEKLTFAGLIRVLVRLDGSFNDAERAAIEAIGVELLASTPEASPYRDTVVPEDGDDAPPATAEDAVWDWIDLAGEECSGDEAVKKAVLATTRREAQLAIYEALEEIAESDSISEGELTLLEFVRTAWNIPAAE